MLDRFQSLFGFLAHETMREMRLFDYLPAEKLEELGDVQPV